MENNKNQLLSPNHNQSTKYDNNNSSASIGYQYVQTLKPAGYIIGDPIAFPNTTTNTRFSERPITPKLGQENSRVASRTNSRIVYSPNSDVIVHEHPSRPVRSPSPISHNPTANIVPQANFIYNSPNPVPRPQTTTMSRVISYSPAKISNVQTFSPPPTPQIDMVPRVQYQRCVSQCKIWQQRYNQLYTQYVQITTSNKNSQNISVSNPPPQTQVQSQNKNNINSQQYEYVIKQNKKLKQRVKQLQRNQQKLYTNMEQIVVKLVNKYRDSLLKQSMLLVDRYRLEKKVNERG